VTRRAEAGSISFAQCSMLFSLAIIAVGAYSFREITHANPFSPFFWEQNAPTVEWIDEPLGIGADEASMQLLVRDQGAGLDEVVIRISQKNAPKELAREKITTSGEAERTVTFKINAKKLELREGVAEISVVAFDKSIWSNGISMAKLLPVTFSKPRIEVVTPQQNGVAGGSQLVFFKIIGKPPSVVGVTDQGSLFPGFQAKYLEPSFKNYDELYFTFFPVPAATNGETQNRLRLVARDEIGNSASSPFPYTTRTRKGSSYRLQFDLVQATKIREYLMSQEAVTDGQVKLSGDISQDMRVLLKIGVAQDEATLSEILRKPIQERLWSGAFGRPTMNYASSSFGDKRTIIVNGVEIYQDTAHGARFHQSNRGSVLAANGGSVIFTGELATLGRTVVIDHGFGLATVYGHLSDARVTPGQKVARGDAIGFTGTSGLAASDEVYFEVRLHGVPVSPNEWWDEGWVKEHIENKITFVQRNLIGEPGE
jgi:murein DD-endopeptidase MepM/ murein hydrolase activator NlpD